MYLVVIAWLYVALMMSVAEATHSNGSLLGAIVTFFFYGLGPIALVVYLMGTPARRQARKQREALDSNTPDTSGHAPAAAQQTGIPPVRKEP